MGQQTRTDLATALLRVSFGLMFIAHGLYLKVFVFGFEGTAGFFGSLGLPGWTAFLVIAAETLAGIALVLGFLTRWASVAVIPVLLGAVWVHIGNGWVFSNQGGGWEYPAYLVILAVAQALLGAGAFSLDRKLGTGS